MKKYLGFLLIFLASLSFAKNSVTNYQRIFLPVYNADGSLMLALRVFKMNDIPSFLLVNPESLKTKVIAISDLRPKHSKHSLKPRHYNNWHVASTRYYQLLNKSTSAPYIIQNQGMTHAENDDFGSILTIDLCPSTKPFEAAFFNKLVQLSDESKKPIPITIAISGMWLIEHPEEFQWLITKKQEHKLDITWANHSFSHIYYTDLPFSENFLLAAGTNLELEFLLTEQYLLEAGEVPGVFFRFPGLISNKHAIKELKKYGLIPLGADAWIAKHQAITPGSIILVHGNGNEPEGITTLLPQLDDLKFMDIKENM